MADLSWYSGSCRRVCIVDGVGAVTSETSVYVFRAGDPTAATRRLLELARAQEEEYENGEGQRVRWALVSLDTVDELGQGQMREVEVYSKMSEIEPADASIALDTSFSPDSSEPGLSGVMGW